MEQVGDRHLDAVVIGAGLSGLAAARRLVAGGAATIVLEARDRVGGRTLTADLAGHAIDLGGQFVGPGQDRVLGLARELGIETARVHCTGRKVLSLAGRRSTYKGSIPKVGLLALLETAWTIRRLDRLAAVVEPDRPWQAPQAIERDRSSLEQWLEARLWTRTAGSLFRIATRAMYAIEPSQLSFLYFLFSLRAGSGFERMAGIEGGAQQDFFVGGAQQLSIRLEHQVGGAVRLNEPVESIEQSTDGVVVRSRTGAHHAHRAIVALAPALGNRIRFTPELSAARRELSAGMVIGSVVKCIVAYDEPFWRLDGYSGEAIADNGLAQVVFDDCSPDGSHSALLVFILGDAARESSRLSPDVRRQAVIDGLVSLFGERAARPSGYIDHDWSSDVWSAGCYGGLFPPGVLSSVGPALREPCGRIHFAGSEAATRWPCYMDGAIESGERAASEVLHLLGR